MKKNASSARANRNRSPNAPQRNEQALQLFVEYAPAAIAMLDRDMKYIAASRRYLVDYGLGEQNLVGRSHYEIFPEIPERWKEIHRRCLAGAIERSDEDPFPRANGQLDWVRWEIRPWYEPAGEIGGIILFSEVITERKQAEAKILRLNRIYATLSQINQAIVRASDRDQFFAEVCRVAIEHGQFRMAWIGLIDAGSLIVKSVAPVGIESGVLTNIRLSLAENGPDGHMPSLQAIREGRCVVANDILNDPALRTWRDDALRLGYRSSAALPIRQHRQVIGVLNVDVSEPNFFDAEQVQLLEEIGADISFALDLLSKDVALRESGERLAGLIASAMDAVITVDAEQRIVLFNAAAERMFGRSAADMIGQPLDGLLPERYHAAHRNHIRRFGETGDTNRMMGRLMPLSALRATGEEFPIEASISQIVVGGQKLFTVIVRDITLRRRAEEEVRSAAQRLANLHEFDRAILAVQSPEEIAGVAAEQLQELTQAWRVTVAMFDHTRRQVQTLAVHGPGQVVYPQHSRVSFEEAGLSDITPLLEGRTNVVDDVTTLPAPSPAVQTLITHGLRSFISIPLIANNEAIGALSLSADHVRAFTSEHIEIAHEIAIQLAVALKQAALHDENARHAAELEQRVIERTAELQAANRQLKQQADLIELADAALIVRDLDSTIVYWNRGAEAMYGWARSEAVGQISHQLLQTQFPESLEAIDRALLTTGYWEGELVHSRHDGSLIIVASRQALQRDENGQPHRILAINIDITERKRAEDAIRQLSQNLEHYATQLETANKELEAFSYSVSHDLRAPLRAINGFARILLEDYAPQLEPEVRRYLGIVCDNAQQMGQLIDDLLAFSRLSRQPLNKQRVDLAEQVRQVLTDLSDQREGRNVELVVGDLLPCEADPVLIRQVLVNLLSNALKFTRPRDLARIEVGSLRSAEVRAQLAGELADAHRARIAAEMAEVSPDSVVYFVRDNGVGFDLQYADKLFGVFQRMHRAEDFEGTGVGLAIVQRIIYRHGGRVWAVAGIGEGAIFYFTL